MTDKRKFADIKSVPGYEELEHVLISAYLQAATGKGAERHADTKPFTEQPMQTIAKSLGSVDGMMFQVNKKLGESRGLPHGRAQAEVLGAIVYSAGVHIAYDSWFTRGVGPDVGIGPVTLTDALGAAESELKVASKDFPMPVGFYQWRVNAGHGRPIGVNYEDMVEIKLCSGAVHKVLAGYVSWLKDTPGTFKRADVAFWRPTK